MTVQPPGWYPDPQDPSRERYWMGNERGSTTRSTGAPADNAMVQPSATSGLRTAGGLLWFFALLDFLGAIVGGVILFTRTGCEGNPFDSSLCGNTTHPLAGIGAAVLVGGLVQAIIVGVVAHLCGVVDDLRARFP